MDSPSRNASVHTLQYAVHPSHIIKCPFRKPEMTYEQSVTKIAFPVPILWPVLQKINKCKQFSQRYHLVGSWQGSVSGHVPFKSSHRGPTRDTPKYASACAWLKTIKDSSVAECGRLKNSSIPIAECSIPGNQIPFNDHFVSCLGVPAQVKLWDSCCPYGPIGV